MHYHVNVAHDIYLDMYIDALGTEVEKKMAYRGGPVSPTIAARAGIFGQVKSKPVKSQMNRIDPVSF